MVNSIIKPKGFVEANIEYKNGKTDKFKFNNTVLRNGRAALAATLANQLNDEFDYYINRMIFGDGGTQGGTPKIVNNERNGLFGAIRVNKPVITTIDPSNATQVVFTSVVSFSEGVGYTLNEMALQLKNGDLYSMATFPDVTKTSIMQLTWSWTLNFI